MIETASATTSVRKRGPRTGRTGRSRYHYRGVVCPVMAGEECGMSIINVNLNIIEVIR